MRGSHSMATALVPMSLLFDRMAYYSVLSVFTLNLTGGPLHLDFKDAAPIYALFMGMVMFSKLMGGVMGDFLLGRRWSMFAGQIFQAIGAMALCIPSLGAVYAGMALVALGSGLYSPNALAMLGSSYRPAPRFLDAGFLILYAAINLGASASSLFGAAGQSTGYWITFAIAGALSLVSGVLAVVTKSPPMRDWPRITTPNAPSSALQIILVLVLGVMYWTAVDFHMDAEFAVSFEARSAGASLDMSRLMDLQGVITLPLLGIMIALAHFERLHAFLKLGLGVVVLMCAGVVGLGVLPSVKDDPSQSMLLLVPFLMMALAEVLAAPMLLAVIGRHAPVRLMGTLFGLSSFSYWVSRKLLNGIMPELEEASTRLALSLGVAFVCLLISLIGWIASRQMDHRGGKAG